MHEIAQHVRYAERNSLRSKFINLLTALTVNAAIVLSVPGSSSGEPAPIVLQRKQTFDRWTLARRGVCGGATSSGCSGRPHQDHAKPHPIRSNCRQLSSLACEMENERVRTRSRSSEHACA